jgi:hypothetical protein
MEDVPVPDAGGGRRGPVVRVLLDELDNLATRAGHLTSSGRAATAANLVSTQLRLPPPMTVKTSGIRTLDSRVRSYPRARWHLAAGAPGPEYTRYGDVLSGQQRQRAHLCRRFPGGVGMQAGHARQPGVQRPGRSWPRTLGLPTGSRPWLACSHPPDSTPELPARGSQLDVPAGLPSQSSRRPSRSPRYRAHPCRCQRREPGTGLTAAV